MRRIPLTVAGLLMERPHDEECRWHLEVERAPSPADLGTTGLQSQGLDSVNNLKDHGSG